MPHFIWMRNTILPQEGTPPNLDKVHPVHPLTRMRYTILPEEGTPPYLDNLRYTTCTLLPG